MSSENVSDVIIDDDNKVIFADEPSLIGIVIGSEGSISIPKFDLPNDCNENNAVEINAPTYRVKRWEDLTSP